jgi:arginine-tRNA-protein transferase
VSLARDRRLEAARAANSGESEAGEESVETQVSNDDEQLIIPGEDKMSLFDIKMPGVLTLEELQSQIDLDHWRLVVGGQLVEFEVCILPTI